VKHLEVGNFAAQVIGDKVRIIQADPLILLSDEVLSLIRSKSLMYTTWDPEVETVTFCDDFGAKFIYRIGAWRGPEAQWEARWPD